MVEQIGVERSKNALAEADLILLVLNYGEELQPDEVKLMEQLRHRQVIVIVNKTDLPQKLDMDRVYAAFFSKQHIVFMSIAEGRGTDDLEKSISDIFFRGKDTVGRIFLCKQCKAYFAVKRGKSSFAGCADGCRCFCAYRYDPN